jgi:hypothetical protein
MRRREIILVWAALMLVAGLGALVGPARAAAEDFRLENRVYAAGENQAKTQSTTIFYRGIIYDFLDDPAEVVIYDKPSKRFILLDPRRRLMAELSTAEVAAFLARLKQRALHQTDPALQFQAEPKLTERFDSAGAMLTLSSEWLTYRARLATVSPTIAKQYREFSDWYAGCNTVLSPGARLPFARWRLNAALAGHQAIPQEVELTIAPKKGGRETALRTTHEFRPALLPADMKRIDETRTFLKTFQPVAIDKYCKR